MEKTQQIPANQARGEKDAMWLDMIRREIGEKHY